MADESSDDNQSTTSKDSPRVIIIGAGIAGIKAAHTLVQSGVNDFVILEASNRTGGRIRSVPLETDPDGLKAELGANWIHGIDLNPIYRICNQHNLISPDSFQGRSLGTNKVLFVREDGRPVNTKVIAEVDWFYGLMMSEIESFYQDGSASCNDSVGDFIENNFQHQFGRHAQDELSLRKMILDNRLLNECIIAGCDSLNQVSLSEIGVFEELPGVHYVIPPGFEAVVDTLKDTIPSEKILLEHPVTQITYKNSANLTQSSSSQYEVCVECQNDKRFYADHVIVTCSLGYLKKHHDRLFNPSLPTSKVDAIHSISMGTVNKLVLEFESKVLPDNLTRLELLWDRSHVADEPLNTRWIKKISCFEVVNAKGNVLIGWISGKEAEYYETLSDEEVTQAATATLSRFLSEQNVQFPKLKKIIRSRWKSNPYTLGSYCFIPVGAHADDIKTLSDPILDSRGQPVVQFAGEATHMTFYSSSHGALLSGEREARRILDLYNH